MRIINCSWVAIIFLLGSCQTYPLSEQPLPSQTFLVTNSAKMTPWTASPTLQDKPTPTTFTPEPATQTLVPSITETVTPFVEGLPISLQYMPVFFRIQETSITMQIGDGEPIVIALAGDLGEIKTAYLAQNDVYLARYQTVQRIGLTDGKVQTLLEFDSQIISAHFLPADDQNRILFSFNFSSGPVIGFIDVLNGTIDPLIPAGFIPRNIYPLGLSPDGKSFFGMSVGDDSDFGPLWVIDTLTGSIIKELPVQASGFATLSPDTRFVVTRHMQLNTSSEPEQIMRVYDLSTPDLTWSDYLLPHQPCTLWRTIWSPDGANAYFFLLDLIDFSKAYGLWLLDRSTGKLAEIMPFTDPFLQIEGFSPDGKWIMIDYENQDGAFFLDLSNGQLHHFSLPVGPRLAGWISATSPVP